ncbi:MAG: carbohydrate binding domain-containing protein [Cyclobacteriaceae bacterium]
MLGSLVLALILFSCEEDEKLTGSNPEGNAVDVSGRITGLSSSTVGGGGTIAINGSGLSHVDKILLNESTWILDFTASESSVEFVVPSFAPVGMNDVTIIFTGNERAYSQFEVVPNPSITYYTPKAAAEGETVTLIGNNLDFVDGVNVGGAAGTITESTGSMLSFTMPGGASTGSIVLTTSSGGTVETSNEIVVCSEGSASTLCLSPINVNGSFENSSIGPADGIEGWSGLNGTLASGEITDEEAYDGFQSVKLTINDVGANPWNIQPFVNVPIDPSGTYQVKLWVKGTGIVEVDFAVDEGGSPGFGRYDSAGPGVTSVDSDEWIELTWEFSPSTEAPPTGDGTSRWAASLSYADNIGGVIYMDNLRIVRID